MNLSILLFEGFETLDAMGPAEVFGRLPRAFNLDFYSLAGGPVKSAQGIAVLTRPADEAPARGALLVPGGMGTRALARDSDFLARLAHLAGQAGQVLSVCTGSALLAACGVLDGRAATSNKLAFDWAAAQGPRVRWQRRARWTRDGRFWTSSGISAGIDMALAFVAWAEGLPAAEGCAREMEYVWNREAGHDPFYREPGPGEERP